MFRQKHDYGLHHLHHIIRSIPQRGTRPPFRRGGLHNLAQTPPYFEILLAVGLALLAPSVCAPQETLRQSLQQKLYRAGIFFRADAPSVLRAREDTLLPVYLEIINGVEKTGHSATAQLAKYLNREPLKLEGVNLHVKPAGPSHQFAEEPLLLGASKDFSFDARTDHQAFVVSDRMKKTLEIPLAAIRSYLGQHYHGGPYETIDLEASFHLTDWPDQNFFLRIRLDSAPLPQMPNWYRGDLHYHSSYTNNPAERGNPLGVTKQVALDSGLNWVVLTDHSTDLSPDDYAQELREVQGYRDGKFLFIRGEEVTVASGNPSAPATLHLIALPSPDDPDKGFPDSSGVSNSVIVTGDGSPGSAPIPLKDALARIVAAGGFAYAAHPFDPISPLLRGGTWDLSLDFQAPGQKDLQAGLVGLEPWNRATRRTADDARDPLCIRAGADPSACFQPDKDANQYTRLEKGIELGWRPLLVAGLQPRENGGEFPPVKVFLAAGSDAHGDFNYEATLDVLDFLSKPLRGISGYAEDNALGKISTVVYCPSGMGRRGENVLQALRGGHSVVSNGPLLIAGFDVNANGSITDAEDIGIGQQMVLSADSFPLLQVEWATSNEFGPLQSLRLIVGSNSGESEPVELSVPQQKKLASEGLISVDLRSHVKKLRTAWGYIRLEARTQNSGGEEFRCYTNPIWVRVAKP